MYAYVLPANSSPMGLNFIHLMGQAFYFDSVQ